MQRIAAYLTLRPHPKDIEEAARELREFLNWKPPHPDDHEGGRFDERQPRFL
jgi:hypothetical protein